MFRLDEIFGFDSSRLNIPITSAFIHAQQLYGKHTAICEDIQRQPLTYQKIITKALALSYYIKQISKPRAHIGIMLPTCNSNVITLFAILFANRIPVCLNFSAGEKNLLSAIRTAEMPLIISSDTFIEKIQAEKMIQNVIQASQVQLLKLESLKNNFPTRYKLKALCFTKIPYLLRILNHRWIAKTDMDSTALVLFTSGSEGTPKGVVLSHANLQANRYQLTAKIDFNSSDLLFNALPMFHSFGLMVGTLLPLLSGVYTFLYPSPLHYKIVSELIYDTNATIMLSTDTFLNGYAKVAHNYDLYNIRYIFAGAEKIKDKTRQIYSEKFGIRILEAYGATEASPGLSLNTPIENKAGSVGKLLPGIEAILEPIEGITHGQKLILKGPNLMKGYIFEDHPNVLVPTPERGYDTGDIVHIDEEGFIFIKDRLKRFAKIAGEMISLGQVENNIATLLPKNTLAVIALSDEKKGEKLCLITDASQEALDALDIAKHLRTEGLSELAIPKILIPNIEIPLLNSGKIDYVTLKKFDFNE